jgi:hypothetical protein
VLSCNSHVDPDASVPLLQNRTEGSVNPVVVVVLVLETYFQHPYISRRRTFADTRLMT